MSNVQNTVTSRVRKALRRKHRDSGPIASLSFFQLVIDGVPTEVEGMTHVGESDGWAAMLRARDEATPGQLLDLRRDNVVVASLQVR